MSSSPNHTSHVENSHPPWQFTIRGLLLVTFCLALLLSIYRQLPPGSVPLLFAALAVAYLLFILWGGIVCLVELFRSILRRL